MKKNYIALVLTAVSLFLFSFAFAQTKVIRLRSTARFNGTSNLMYDSTVYSYSGMNGTTKFDNSSRYIGDLNDSMEYVYNAYYNSGVMTPYSAIIKHYPTGNSHPDTVYEKTYDKPSQKMGPRAFHVYTYDGSGRVLTDGRYEWSQFSTPPAYYLYYKYEYKYNTAGQLITSSMLQDINGLFTTSWQDSNTYDANGKLQVHYARNYMMNTSQLENWWIDSMFYNGNGHLVLQHRYSHSAGNSLYYSHYMDYNVDAKGNTLSSKTYYTSTVGGAWGLSATDSAEYDAAGYYTLYEAEHATSSGWEKGPMILYNYDTAHRITYIDPYQWNNVNWTSGHVDVYNERFHYETVTQTPPPNTGISNAAVLAGMRLYPNPASGMVTISLDKAPGADNNISLHDAAGRTLRSFTAVADQKEIMIPLHGMPSGIYYLTVTTREGQKTMPVHIK